MEFTSPAQAAERVPWRRAAPGGRGRGPGSGPRPCYVRSFSGCLRFCARVGPTARILGKAERRSPRVSRRRYRAGRRRRTGAVSCVGAPAPAPIFGDESFPHFRNRKLVEARLDDMLKAQRHAVDRIVQRYRPRGVRGRPATPPGSASSADLRAWELVAQRTRRGRPDPRPHAARADAVEGSNAASRASRAPPDTAGTGVCQPALTQPRGAPWSMPLGSSSDRNGPMRRMNITFVARAATGGSHKYGVASYCQAIAERRPAQELRWPISKRLPGRGVLRPPGSLGPGTGLLAVGPACILPSLAGEGQSGGASSLPAAGSLYWRSTAQTPSTYRSGPPEAREHRSGEPRREHCEQPPFIVAQADRCARRDKPLDGGKLCGMSDDHQELVSVVDFRASAPGGGANTPVTVQGEVVVAHPPPVPRRLRGGSLPAPPEERRTPRP